MTKNISDFMRPFATGKKHEDRSWEEICQLAKSSSENIPFPFSAMLPYIQQRYACRILIQVIEKWEADELKGPVACFTKWFEQNVFGKVKYEAHHVILVHPEHLGGFASRFGIGHELGHICLHLSQLNSSAKIDAFREHFLKDDLGIEYTEAHEADANLFGLMLCLFRNGERVRRPSSLKKVKEDWKQCKDKFPNRDSVDFMFDEMFSLLPELEYPMDFISFVEEKLQIHPEEIEKFRTKMSLQFDAMESNLTARKLEIAMIVKELFDACPGHDQSQHDKLVESIHDPVRKILDYTKGTA